MLGVTHITLSVATVTTAIRWTGATASVNARCNTSGRIRPFSRTGTLGVYRSEVRAGSRHWPRNPSAHLRAQDYGA